MVTSVWYSNVAKKKKKVLGASHIEWHTIKFPKDSKEFKFSRVPLVLVRRVFIF